MVQKSVALIILLLTLFSCYQDLPQKPKLNNPFDPQNHPDDLFYTQAILKGDSVIIHWHAISHTNLKQYHIYRQDVGIEDFVPIGQTQDTVWIDTAIESGHSYQYAVTAENMQQQQTDPGYIVPAVVHTTPVLIVNDGQNMLFGRNVAITIQAASAIEMWISISPAFSDGDWQPFHSPASYMLPNKNGWYVIYVKVKYPDQTISDVVKDSIFVDVDSSPMVLIPAGDYYMGSNDNNSDRDEQPAHRVHIEAFWMDKYEVTNLWFVKFLNDGNGEHFRYGMKIVKNSDGTFSAIPEFENHPVIFVSYETARAYASWRGCTLPTEAQWERAARGKVNRDYPWGDDIAMNQANFWGNNDPFEQNAPATTPVGFFDGQTHSGYATKSNINAYELYDMAGNVWEWCLDWYDANYYQNSPVNDPTGPTTGTTRVVRGGSWRDESYYCRVTARSFRQPYEARDNVGFRCVRPQ